MNDKKERTKRKGKVRLTRTKNMIIRPMDCGLLRENKKICIEIGKSLRAPFFCLLLLLFVMIRWEGGSDRTVGFCCSVRAGLGGVEQWNERATKKQREKPRSSYFSSQDESIMTTVLGQGIGGVVYQVIRPRLDWRICHMYARTDTPQLEKRSRQTTHVDRP